ncbi:MAG: UDP-N-acetylglucosamine 1-carboxyvinyltransferase [Candidatus Paceibacterota bacterium]
MNKDLFLIKGLGGKKKLNGTIPVFGAKNAALKAMAASILFKDDVKYENIPFISDIEMMSEILSDLGAEIEKTGKYSMNINSEKAKKTELDRNLSKRMRASVVLTGPILARFGEVSFPHPGGCVIGERPIDMFLEGFKKMGAEVSEAGEKYYIKAKDGKLKGAEIFFKMQSVTNTETFILAGVLAEGKTVLKNCALEPEISNLAEFLIECGAKIKGVSTATIEIEGTGGKLLESKGKVFKTIPDRIEAGSFLILATLAGDNIEITNCEPKHLEILIDTLRRSGVKIDVEKNSIKVSNNGKVKNSSLTATNIKTHEYPGFPTDLQAPMAVYLTQVSGESVIFETIFEGRLNYINDLARMGADVKVWDSHQAMIKGPTELKGKELDGPDLRAGLAYILAAIIAKGNSVINNVHFVDRGYEKIEERLQKIGVEIERVAN